MLPTSNPGATVNATLRPLEMQPAATPSAINALFQAFRDGYVTSNDIQDRITQKPIRDKVERASGEDALDALKNAPIRRRQEMDAEDQQRKLRDLQIKGHQEVLDEAPVLRDQNRKLRDIQIKEGELTIENAKNPLGKIEEKTAAEMVAEYIRNNPGKPLPRDASGKLDLKALGDARNSQTDLSPVLGPDGKPVSGLGKDNKGNIHSMPRSAAPTEQQANAQMYAERMAFQRPILEGYETGQNKSKYDPTTKAQMPEVNASNPLATPFRLMTTSDHNTYRDAKKNWIAAVLRKESGAAISKSEEVNADAQYFPQPGDTSDQVKQKQLLRQTVEQKMHKQGELPGVSTPGDHNAPAPASAEPANANPSGATEVTSQQAYEALPPGSQYRFPGDPPGQLRTKAGQAQASAPIQPLQRPIQRLNTNDLLSQYQVQQAGAQQNR